MKKLLLIVLVLISACARGPRGKDGVSGPSGANGSNGSNGLNGTDGIVKIMHPCGASSKTSPEVFICLNTGEVLVSYSDAANGKNTRLALLQTGNYVTSDGQNCTFSALKNSYGTLISWSKGSESCEPSSSSSAW